jgi:hypothetical protein
MPRELFNLNAHHVGHEDFGNSGANLLHDQELTQGRRHSSINLDRQVICEAQKHAIKQGFGGRVYFSENGVSPLALSK